VTARGRTHRPRRARPRLPLGDVDGTHGNRTRHAVQRFQQCEHLAATGAVEAATWRVLRA